MRTKRVQRVEMSTRWLPYPGLDGYEIGDQGHVRRVEIVVDMDEDDKAAIKAVWERVWVPIIWREKASRGYAQHKPRT